jgi:hypothetical protein
LFYVYYCTIDTPFIIIRQRQQTVVRFQGAVVVSAHRSYSLLLYRPAVRLTSFKNLSYISFTSSIEGPYSSAANSSHRSLQNCCNISRRTTPSFANRPTISPSLSGACKTGMKTIITIQRVKYASNSHLDNRDKHHLMPASIQQPSMHSQQLPRPRVAQSKECRCPTTPSTSPWYLP